MYSFFKPILFRADPERAHAATLALLRMAGRLAPVRGLLARLYRVEDPRLEVAEPGCLSHKRDRAWKALLQISKVHRL